MFNKKQFNGCKEILFGRCRHMLLRMIGVIFVISLILYLYITSYPFRSYQRKNEILHDCEFYQKRMTRTFQLTQNVHDTLNKHNISHFLMYGSVWGPLRGYQGPLPWDYDVDFGTLFTRELRQKLAHVQTDLFKLGIFTHEHTESGNYDFRFFEDIGKPIEPVVEIFLFKKTYFGKARRIGKEVVLLFYHYYLHHTIPYRLIDKDLPSVQFAGRSIQTPKEGIEIMKYLYRENWDVERKPAFFNCIVKYGET